MGKELFGTDGIRGIAGDYPLDPRTVHAFGMALGADVRLRAGDPEILIGADTRESGPWIAEQVAGGLQRQGVRARYAGVATTPGIAYLTRSGPFAAGVMISASHNPYHDNGLKVFSHSGFKLPDEEEHLIEREILRLLDQGVEPAALRLDPDPGLDQHYLDYLISTVSSFFEDIDVVLDCGNGSAWYLGPDLFRRLGVRVKAIGAEPNGRNINDGCGALYLDKLRRVVVDNGAACGVAFDGDADRAMFVSRSGRIVDGDAVLLAAARALKAAGRLKGDLVVATVMSNFALEAALKREGIRLVRTPVGDKYVLEEIERSGAVLGGEQSGHVIFREYATTGDGLLTALRVLELMQCEGLNLDVLLDGMPPYPQRLVNIPVREKPPLEGMPEIQAEIRRGEQALGDSGRVLVRYSGTEPLARVMVEGPDAGEVETFSERIADAIRRRIGA